MSDDDQAIIEAGYRPQLQRSLGFFSSFAIPFSEISITTGIFANYGFVLNKAGPFGYWTWLLVAIGHTLTALVFAEMAGRMPLTGSCYNWTSKLAGPTVGWFTGWLATVGFSIGVAAVTTAMLPIIGIIIGHDIDGRTGALIASALIVVQMLINLQGVRLTSHTNIIAVIAEIIGIVGLTILIGVTVANHGSFHFELLTTIPDEPKPYWPAFLMSSLLGAWTMLGFECSADVSEETINTRTITPKGMVLAVLASAIIGFIFIVVMTLAIPDLASVSKDAYPLAFITSYYLGDGVTKIFLAFALIAMFACAMVVLTAASRNLFAIARDGRFIASQVFSRVSGHHVPKNAIFLISAVAIAFTFLTDSATSLYGAATVCGVLYYLITVVSFAIKAPKLPATTYFSVGRWHWPIVVLAALWLVIEIAILTVPEEFHSVAAVTSGIIVIGLVLFAVVGRKNTPLANAN